jgi:hypothetical protein
LIYRHTALVHATYSINVVFLAITKAASPLLADFVAKVFCGWPTKILKTADAFFTRRREGSHRFSENDHGASYRRYKVLRRRSGLRISFCEIFSLTRFSTFATLSAQADVTACVYRKPKSGRSDDEVRQG